ncbi:MAG: FUSC family protein [Methanospirillum sp.]
MNHRPDDLSPIVVVSPASAARAVPLSLCVGAALGMAVPVALGAAAGQVGAGMLAALGGLAVSGAGTADTLRTEVALLASAALVGTAAVLFGSAIGSGGWGSAAALVFVVTLAALFGGFGRTAARLAAIFTAFAIIGTALDAGEIISPVATALVVGVGAAWAASITLLASASFRVFRREAAPPAPRSTPPSFRRRWRRWVLSLRRLDGWEYALRVGLCITVAQAVAVPWNQPWAYWIPLVTVIVVRRSVEETRRRAWQRALGTAVGVLVGSLILSAGTPIWLLIGAVGLLAAARPVLREYDYTLYAAAMTPLLVILLEFGTAPAAGMLVYRLADTGIGALIAYVVGALLWARLRPALVGNAIPGGHLISTRSPVCMKTVASVMVQAWSAERSR